MMIQTSEAGNSFTVSISAHCALKPCRFAGATKYVSGPAAKNYLIEEEFRKEGIDVEWISYSDYPQYLQLFGPFEHKVSVLDLIFNEGPHAKNYMKSFHK
jgi:hypothetical protein